MIKIDLNKQLLGLDDTDTGENLGKILGSHLVTQSKGDILKYYDWAVALYKGNEISVDESDFEKIKEFIKNTDSLYVLAKAQMLRALDECKSKES